jgi:hypothetical protein
MEILRAAAAMRSSSSFFAFFGLCITRFDATILQSAAKVCKARQSDAAPLKRLSLSFYFCCPVVSFFFSAAIFLCFL